MFGIVQAIGALSSLGILIFKEVAARWGYKVALIAAIVAVYLAAWAAVGAALAAAFSLIPANPITPAMAQFFPAKTAVASGAAMLYGTMATLKSWDYFKMVAGVAAKIGA